MLTNTNLLKAVQNKRFTFISTGMSNMKDIEKAVKIFRKNKCKFSLMHCVSAYPCDDKEFKSKLNTNLQKKFKVDIGYSGHEKVLVQV